MILELVTSKGMLIFGFWICMMLHLNGVQASGRDMIQDSTKHESSSNHLPKEEALKPKILHAEPLYIDLIRGLGARKGEREWNVGWLAVVYLGLGACGGGEGVVSREYAMVVSDMTCESCIGPIRVALQGVEGVLDSRFDLSVQTVVVEVAVDLLGLL
jgi:hypothetical protein